MSTSPGPLQAIGSGQAGYQFDKVGVNQTVALAALIFYNSGKSSLLLESVSPLGAQDVQVAGIGFVRGGTTGSSRYLPIPGTYDAYPPSGMKLIPASRVGLIEPNSSSSNVPRPAILGAIGLRLSSAGADGQIAGVIVRYRTADGAQREGKYIFPTVLCREENCSSRLQQLEQAIRQTGI